MAMFLPIFDIFKKAIRHLLAQCQNLIGAIAYPTVILHNRRQQRL